MSKAEKDARFASMQSTLNAIAMDCKQFLEGKSEISAYDLIAAILEAAETEELDSAPYCGD